MGFYSPSQLTQDLRRHEGTILAADVCVSEWECTLEYTKSEPTKSEPKHISSFPRKRESSVVDTNAIESPRGRSEHKSERAADLSSPPALRLGLCMVKGLSEVAGKKVVATRGAQAFADVDDLARRANLNRHDMEALAAAGALGALSGHRRHAIWDVSGIERMPPLLADSVIDEMPPALIAPSEGEDIVADYASLGLTLGRHPLALLRERLQRQHMLTAAELRELPHGRIARVTGLVTGRQRPGTASGVTFVTLEDETGMVNVIVWRDLAERQRKELLRSNLLTVYGTLERAGEVVHLIAGRLRDQSAMLGKLTTRSRDFH
jgi:error-prone DNA polymerase